jgi:hypothetical protein
MPAEIKGAFEKGVARLSEHGDLTNDANGIPLSLSDIYSVWLGRGIRATSANVTGVPAANSAHPSVPDLFVGQVRFTCIDNGAGVWNISVDYERDTSATDDEGDGETLKITARGWDTTESFCDLLVDAVSGAPIVNAAGDPFDSVPQRPIYAPKVTFTRMESRSPVIGLNGSINSAEVTVLGMTYPAFTAKVKVSATDTMATSGRRYQCNYEIEGRNNFVLVNGSLVNIGWRDCMIESGYTFVKDGKRYKFTEKVKNTQGEEEEKEVSSPQLLTASGGDGRGEQPVLKIIMTHRSANWTSLKLPS